MNLPEFSTRYPVTVAMATLAVVLLGWISLDGLGTDLLPDLQTPVVTVEMTAPGKSPRELEERYTQRLERDVSTIQGVKRVYSITRSGQAVVVAEFAWDADMDFGVLDVQKKVSRYAAADDVSQLDVTREDPLALPVMRIGITASEDTDLDALLGTVELLIKPKLEALDGVASAEIEGGAEKEVRVSLDPYLLEAFGMNPDAVVSRIQQADADVSGGTLRENQQSYLVKALGRLNDINDVREVIVGEKRGAGGPAVSGDRVPVRVRDVGTVALEYQERETIVRLNGQECIGLGIYKEAGSNTVAVVNTVLDAISDLEADLGGMQFTVVENQARFVEDAIGEVEESAVHGAILAIIVLLLALRSWTVTLVIGLAIPISVLATFTLMYFEGLTLNIMTLGGLALGAGMLVDNAIVVIENIYRHLEDGDDAMVASSQGASEVGVAILASTLTTVAVFLPIVYLQGLAGELFKDQAWTVAFSLLSSLVVAMTTIPMLSSRIFRRLKIRPKSSVRIGRYYRFLDGVLNHKVILFGITLLALGGTGYVALDLQTEFIPREDQGLFQVNLTLPEGSRVELSDHVASRAKEIIERVGAKDIAHVYARVGVDPTRIAGGEPTGPNRATLSVALVSGRSRTVSEMITQIDPLLSDMAEVEVKYKMNDTALEGVMGGDEAPIQVEVSGENLEILARITKDLQTRVESLPSIYNVRTSFQGGQPEVDLAIRDEVASAFGLTTQTISRTLERQLTGEVAGELSKDQRTRDIRVKYQDVDLRQLQAMRIEGSDGAILTLGDIADLNIIEGPREILRENQRRVGRITGYLSEGSILSEAIVDVRATLVEMAVPTGYRVAIGGEEREREESFGSLKFALILSIVLVYMVMASLFESILHPFTVMLSVPLAGIGVVFAFWGLGEPLSVMAYIGIIMLGGIAVNDAIVLVDHINQLRQDGLSLRESVLQGGQDRLRPIMMTSATTILALLPMAIGFGEGAKLRAPMAIAVIGGLITSTLMTLVVVPTMYEVIDRLRGKSA